MNSPAPSPSSPPPNQPPALTFNAHHTSSTIAIDATIAATSVSLLILLIILFSILYRKKKRHHSIITDPDDTNNSVSIAILHANSHPLADIDFATDGFHPSHVIGKGRLGTVYKATSTSTGHLFAFKRIHSHIVLSNSGSMLEFSSKLKSLSFINHPNVVPILGYSEAPGERIIITELVNTRSLDEVLDWRLRLRIAAGAARGIEHLHEGVSALGIVHGRVKLSNVLIDLNYCGRVCDYGLSFLEQSGNKGRAVEGFDEGKEEDVYGFGVVLLEILSGRRAEVEQALPLIRTGRMEELLDTRIRLPKDMRALVRMAKVASACVGNGRLTRPSIAQVAAILSSLEMLPFR